LLKKLYGIFKTIETVSNKTPELNKAESMMIPFCQLAVELKN
jgi:hypothetical protein